MSAARIPAVHQAIVLAAVKAVLGERAVIREIVEVPGAVSPPEEVSATKYEIHKFWCRWTGRQFERELDKR